MSFEEPAAPAKQIETTRNQPTGLQPKHRVLLFKHVEVRSHQRYGLRVKHATDFDVMSAFAKVMEAVHRLVERAIRLNDKIMHTGNIGIERHRPGYMTTKIIEQIREARIDEPLAIG